MSDENPILANVFAKLSVLDQDKARQDLARYGQCFVQIDQAARVRLISPWDIAKDANTTASEFTGVSG